MRKFLRKRRAVQRFFTHLISLKITIKPNNLFSIRVRKQNEIYALSALQKMFPSKIEVKFFQLFTSLTLITHSKNVNNAQFRKSADSGRSALTFQFACTRKTYWSCYDLLYCDNFDVAVIVRKNIVKLDISTLFLSSIKNFYQNAIAHAS